MGNVNSKKKVFKSRHPLVLRFTRVADAFAKSDDERDFYLDTTEGFLLFVSLDKEEDELQALYEEIERAEDRYKLVPKMTLYEVKKFMEGFITEKVFDIDLKEKLFNIINSREARENFLEFLYDHVSELDKWQIYYQDRAKARIIEWLLEIGVSFVFEEDLNFPVGAVDKVKKYMFSDRVPKDVKEWRSLICSRAKVYESHEARNPKPKRGRPSKKQTKPGDSLRYSLDRYQSIDKCLISFLFTPDTNALSAFSSKYYNDEQMVASLCGNAQAKESSKLRVLSGRLESLLSVPKLKGPESEGMETEISSLSRSVVMGKDISRKDRVGGVVKGVLSEVQVKQKGGKFGRAPTKRVKHVSLVKKKERGG